MRSLLSLLLVATALSACRLEPPGAIDLYAAHQIYYGPDNARYGGETLTADSLARIYTLLDRAVEAGHPTALMMKGHVASDVEGLLAAEPIWTRVATDTTLTWATRDVGYVFLSLAAKGRPALVQGLGWQDIPRDSVLQYTDVIGEAQVWREAAAAGSARADSALDAHLRVLREQAAAGNADADSLLLLLDA